MPAVLVFDPLKKETELIASCFRDFAASNLSDDWQIAVRHAQAATIESLPADIRLFCTDVTAGGTEAITPLRQDNRDLLITVIANADTSPFSYMRPEIMAAGLLLRPFDRSQIERMFEDIFSVIRSRERESLFDGRMFVKVCREETIRVPFSQILFFEARDKKIVLCTASSETCFYATLDSLANALPEYFLRCHKGFIVNTLLVERFVPAQSVLQLAGGFQVPVSRGCKAAVKEALA